MSIAVAGLAMGFLGSAHCIGMCGGIAGATSALPRGDARAARLLACHAGRIASYSIMGGVAGALGATFAGFGGTGAMLALRAVAAVVIVAAGLHVAGFPVGLGRLEAAGAVLWRRIAPLARRARTGESLASGLLFGALWGWLPCGFVYSALAVAAAAGSPLAGVLVMAGFGVGTLPATLAIGFFAGGAASLLRSAAARRMAGAMVVSFGIWTFASAALGWASAPAAAPACHAMERAAST